MPAEDLFQGGRVAIVAAHPDDETIGAGGHFAVLEQPVFLHLTDGAPRDGRDAAAAGFAGWQDYARARRQELLHALEVSGIPPERALELGCADQEASYEMAALARRLAALLARLRPRVVLTHPYEGGHPDHDAAAFAVQAACGLLAEPPAVWEFTSYHASGNGSARGEFLPAPGAAREIRTVLSQGACRLKREMFACFATQAGVLRDFRVDEERFRPARAYDFTVPPHPGPLHYERFAWGMTGARWRELARRALASLGREAAA